MDCFDLIIIVLETLYKNKMKYFVGNISLFCYKILVFVFSLYVIGVLTKHVKSACKKIFKLILAPLHSFAPFQRTTITLNIDSFSSPTCHCG